MTNGWINLAILAVFLTMILGVCCRLGDGNRTQELIGCTSGCKSGCTSSGASGCTLSPRVLAERKISVEATLGLKTLERTELDDGIAIRFPTDSQTVKAVFDFVTSERGCCGHFITFELILNGGDGPFWLRLRGDKKAKEFLKDMFSVDTPIAGS